MKPAPRDQIIEARCRKPDARAEVGFKTGEKAGASAEKPKVRRRFSDAEGLLEQCSVFSKAS